MVNYIRSWMTFIVTAASIIFMVPAACSSPVPPRNISQVEQTAETKDPGDSCLPNQFLSLITLTCENCTFCTQGTEHSTKGQCGYGRGAKTTCTPCAEGFFQTGEGYSGLVCSRCVTCDLNAKYRQNCTPTQDARCGPCPPGEYEFLPNICLGCKNDPSHPDCPQPNTIKPTASSNQSAPTLPSSIPLHDSTAPDDTTPPPLSSQAHNTSNDFDEEGTPTKKRGSLLSVVIAAIVTVIVMCVIYLAIWVFKKWEATNTNRHVLPSKSPDGETGQLIPSPAIDVATPGPAIAAAAIVTPAPAIATPAPAIVTPAPAIATPAPGSATPAPAIATPGSAIATPAPAIATPGSAIATPAPAIATPAPAIATPGSAIATPGSAIATPAPAIATPGSAIATPAPVRDLPQGASNPGNQPAASVSTDVSNTETSVPRALCSDGGPVGDHDAWNQNQQNHVPGSPDSAKDNFVFENDDGSVMSLPMDLMSNELA